MVPAKRLRAMRHYVEHKMERAQGLAAHYSRRDWQS
jgi:hypothetical protein